MFIPVALYVYKTTKSLTANSNRALKRQNVEIYDSYFVIIRYEKIGLLTTKYNVPHRHTVGSSKPPTAVSIDIVTSYLTSYVGYIKIVT